MMATSTNHPCAHQKASFRGACKDCDGPEEVDAFSEYNIIPMQPKKFKKNSFVNWDNKGSNRNGNGICTVKECEEKVHRNGMGVYK